MSTPIHASSWNPSWEYVYKDRSDPDVEVLAARLAGLADDMPAGSREADILSALAQRFAAPQMRLVFAGRFSVGKSTLINCALGRPLMPADDVAETGVACQLRRDRCDRIIVDDIEGRRRVVPCTTDEIARATSLQTSEGPRNQEVERTANVDIRLADFPGGNACWIDSPGIDSGAETARAEQAAATSDLLIWVLRSGQLLSLTESKAIAAHLRRRGPSSVVLVLNVFLEPARQSPTGWRSFIDTNLAPYTQRLRQHIEGLGLPFEWNPEIVLVAAQQGLAAREEFGRPDLMALLARYDHPGSRAARQLRVAQVQYNLDAVAGIVRERREAVSDENTRRAAAIAERDAADRRSIEQYESRVRTAVQIYVDGVAQFARQLGATISSSIAPESLDRSGGYTTWFAQRLREEEERQLARIVERLSDARSCEWHLDPGHATLRETLAVGTVPIHVPQTEADAGWGGAVIGGVLGTVFLFGLGTGIGAAIGKEISSKAGASKALAEDVAAARRNALETGDRAARKVLGASEAAVEDILTHSFVRTFELEEPDGETFRRLSEVLDSIRAVQGLAQRVQQGASA